MGFPSLKLNEVNSERVPLLPGGRLEEEKRPSPASYLSTRNPQELNTTLWTLYQSKALPLDKLVEKVLALYQQGADACLALWVLGNWGDKHLKAIQTILDKLQQTNADIKKILNQPISFPGGGTPFTVVARTHQLQTGKLFLENGGDLFSLEAGELPLNWIFRNLILTEEDTLRWGESREGVKRNKASQLSQEGATWEKWIDSNEQYLDLVLSKIIPEDLNQVGEWGFVPFYWPHFQQKKKLEILLYQKYTGITSENFCLLLAFACKIAQENQHEAILLFFKKEKKIAVETRFTQVDLALLNGREDPELFQMAIDAVPFSLVQLGPFPSINTLGLARLLERETLVQHIKAILRNAGCKEIHIALIEQRSDEEIIKLINVANYQDLLRSVPTINSITPSSLATLYQREKVLEAIEKRLHFLQQNNYGVGLVESKEI